MKRSFVVFSSLAVLASCGRAPAPALGPEPVTATGIVPPVTTTVVASGDTSATSDTVPRAAKDATAKDTAKVSASEVKRRAAEVFGDAAQAPSILQGSTADSAEHYDGPSWDIDVHSYETTDRVERYLRMFSGAAKDRIAAQLEEGSRFEPMIRAKMRAGGIPEDMYYLALIESGFDPNAYSKAAAVGMWQFMASTARGMGMRVDWWVDERRDPIRSTTAAVSFLRGLREQLGSLYLAAAAYNGGPGRIARGLSRYADDLEGTAAEDRFFVLADKDFLPRETREYVPQLIAAALIAKEPRRYGMEIRTLPPFEYDSVRVGPATPVAAIAKASGTTVREIQSLNPHILRGMTPPRDSFRVRIPLGSAAEFDNLYAGLSKEDRTAYRKVESKKNEYPESIASRAGITTRQLMLFNPKLLIARRSGRLVAGQIVLVPTRAVALAATNAPDPRIERYSSGTRTHIVRRGESLGSIAKKYRTSVKSLMALNGLRRSIIFPGQSLVVAGRPRSAGRGSRSASRTAATRQSGVVQAGKPRAKKK